MTDRDKIVGELEYCKNNPNCSACEGCQRGGRGVATCESLVDDVIALLKEQIKPIRINTNYEQSWKCGQCGSLVNTHFKYCPYCGRSLRWGNEIPGI